MAKIFLDTNILIDLYDRNPKIAKLISGHTNYISPLSCHILCYVNKVNIPSPKLSILLSGLSIVELTRKIVSRAIEGPTDDIEDNIQLHSAADSSCDYFLTNDKLLLKMKFFGQLKILDTL